MTQTTNLGLTLLEVGQREKEATINEAFAKIDVAFGNTFLGDLATDPLVTGHKAGTTYFNTTVSKLKVLRGNLTWVNVA
jgi:3-deoxy-D-manno-octulosonate 8-phosphate phosphatase KdsC-like HAD superfamily phosphatase